MKPAYVWWDRQLGKRYQDELVKSIESVIRAGEDGSNWLDVKVIGNYNLGNGAYQSPEWYLNSCFNPVRKQVNAKSILFKCVSEPWQEKEPHFEIIGASQDLWSGDRDNNFVYGLTIPGVGTITSPQRMINWYGPNAPLVYTNLTVHEDGHLFGVPDENRGRDLDHTIGAHCKLTDCVMGQVNVAGRPDALQATRNVLERYRRTGSYFCDDCTEDLVQGKKKWK